MNKQIRNTLVLLSLNLMLGFGASAQAAIKVYVKNCSGSSLKVVSFNGKDSVRLSEYQSKTISNGDSASLKCKGEGKGSTRKDGSCGNSGEQKVKKNKWIKYTDCGA